MNAKADPQAIIQSAPPGTALYARIDAGQGWETAIFIREESARIAELGAGPRVEIRTALLVEGDVALIPLFVRLGASHEKVYETWLNAHQTGGGMQFLADLATQPRIAVILYGDRGRERAIQSPNLLRDSFAEILARVGPLPAWTMAEFDAARERLYTRYPSPGALWQGLER